MKIKWDNQGFDKFNSAEYDQKLRELSKTEGTVVHSEGDFEKAFSDSPVKLEALYETPIVSHSPMEPMNCVVQWTGADSIEVWVSAQGPDLVKGELSHTLGLSRDNIKVNIFLMAAHLAEDYILILPLKLQVLQKRLVSLLNWSGPGKTIHNSDLSVH